MPQIYKITCPDPNDYSKVLCCMVKGLHQATKAYAELSKFLRANYQGYPLDQLVMERVK